MANVGEGQEATAATTPAAAEAAGQADKGFAFAKPAMGGPVRDEEPSRPAPANGPSPLTERQKLAMRATRNARYHEDREGHFDRLNRLSNFLVLALGSSSVVAGLSAMPWLATMSGGLTATLGAAQLVFDFSGQASLHRDLRKGFLSVCTRSRDEAQPIASLNAEMEGLYCNEPPTFHAVNIMAWNTAQLAFGRPRDTLAHVPWWRARLRHFCRFDPAAFT
ncbi:hypothetical protein [Chelatococcus sp.]|uniref:hypothetical protein n=1 Tax=Chelatococcus sp. TaxID=1953771 RepID=UPI001EC38E57|nr:hypothetical protein [Chelatococcus sp.]MBX3543754.1 hypothetical protein [Chelatococcus sp.]